MLFQIDNIVPVFNGGSKSQLPALLFVKPGSHVQLMLHPFGNGFPSHSLPSSISDWFQTPSPHDGGVGASQSAGQLTKFSPPSQILSPQFVSSLSFESAQPVSARSVLKSPSLSKPSEHSVVPPPGAFVH